MPVDDYTASSPGGESGRSVASLGVFVPGLWESIRRGYLEEIERGDMRSMGLDLTERQLAKFNASPHSTVSQAKSHLASMDAGEPEETWPPNSRDFPVVANVEWMRGPGRCPRVLVWPDDWVEPHWPDWAPEGR
jgi:hypothetical protein